MHSGKSNAHKEDKDTAITEPVVNTTAEEITGNYEILFFNYSGFKSCIGFIKHKNI